MNGTIQLNNPQDIVEHISHETDVIYQYEEVLRQEMKNLSAIERLVSEMSQNIKKRESELLEAIEHNKKYEDSIEKQRAIDKDQKILEACKEQAHIIAQCLDDLISIRHDYSIMVKDATRISDNFRIFQSKMETFIGKIIDAM